MMDAYEVFADAAKTNALKVVLTSPDPRPGTSRPGLWTAARRPSAPGYLPHRDLVRRRVGGPPGPDGGTAPRCRVGECHPGGAGGPGLPGGDAGLGEVELLGGGTDEEVEDGGAEGADSSGLAIRAWRTAVWLGSPL